MSARIAPGGGSSNVATGIPVLDHLLGLLARSGGSSSPWSCRPGRARRRSPRPGRRSGVVRRRASREGFPGHGSAFMPAEEALAQIVFEVSDRRSSPATSI
jgi:imidazoleglycerol phosphate dehydratase HisB